MSSDGVCRLCLAVDVRMLSLIPLQALYEKVTKNHLRTDQRPVTACNICVAQLKRCHKFLLKCERAENVLMELLATHAEVTPKSIALIDRAAEGLGSSLSTSQVKHETFASEFQVDVKSEWVHEELHLKDEDNDNENMTVSEAEDESDDDIPLGNMKHENSREEPGSSRVAEVSQSSDEPTPLPLEVSIKVEEDHSLGGTLEGRPAGEETREHDTQETGAIPWSKYKIYECNYCEKVFTSKYNYTTHTRAHTGEKPFHCHLCPKSYICKGSLKDHLKRHTGEKPHECEICHKTFVVKRNLNTHLKTHRERPYKCSICSSRFYEPSKLKYHFRVHTGEEPCECKYCHKKFKFSSSLNRHLRVHTGEKPYECNVCNKRFNQRGHLRNHLKTHAGKELEITLADLESSQGPVT